MSQSNVGCAIIAVLAEHDTDHDAVDARGRTSSVADPGEATPRWYEYFELFRGNFPEPTPFDCEPIVDSGLGRLIAMETLHGETSKEHDLPLV